MMGAVGFPALRIVRIKMGNLELPEMLSGDVIELKSAEVYEKLFYSVIP